MRGILQDGRFSYRELRKSPGVALTAILSITLGIGATTAVFSVIYGLLVNPFPYQGANRMVYLTVVNQATEDREVELTGPQLKTLAQAKCIESLSAGWGTWNLTTTGEDLPEDVPALYFTANSGAHFGVPALLGRTLVASDGVPGQDPQPVAVLGYTFWQRHFHTDPKVLGRTLQLVHRNYTIFPKKLRVSVQGINDYYVKHLGHSLFLLFGAVALLLLIGCANVSILLLARGTARQHELAVRAAIGASRWRMQQHLLTEALMLSLLGAAGGVLLAYRLLPTFLSWLPEQSFPHAAVIQVNLPVLFFSVAVAILTGVLFGLSPAFEFSRPQVAQLIQPTSRRATEGRRGKRTHAALVAGQIALTLLLLTSAAAAINGFMEVLHVDLGYDPHNVMSVGIPVHQNSHVSWEDRSVYFERIRARIATLPEVVAAGISTNATPPSSGSDESIEIFGRPASQQEEVRANFVSPEYFQVLRIPLLRGRFWEHPEIVHGARLAVINSTMARQYWPKGDALGKQLRLTDLKAEPPFSQAVPDSNSWLQIIGIVADARNDGLRKPVKSAVFVPFSLRMGMWTQILVKTRVAPLAALNRVRAEVKAIDSDQQVFGKTRSLDQWIERESEYAYGRLVAALFSGFSLLALALAAVGLFSVVSYSVAQRTNEFGIRMALGAMRAQVLRLVLASTVSNVIGGVIVGLLLSLLLSRFLSKSAEGSTHHPLFVAGVTLLLISTSALAASIPALRASSVDPMEALRYE